VTYSHASAPLVVTGVDAAFDALRARGLRVSAARRLVLEVLFAAEEPVSADQIAAGLRGRVPASDLASVYRNLERLEELGLVRHLHFGHGPGVYAIVGRGDGEYLVCEWCGSRRAVEPGGLEDIRGRLRALFDWEARFSHFPIVGLCPSCAGRADERGRGGSHAHT
jgi:Fur family transcriptional regulator, ferric uptake regulator